MRISHMLHRALLVQVALDSRALRTIFRLTHCIGRYAGSIAIDGAIGALGGLDQMLAEGEIALLAQVHNAIRPQHPH
jgi:hypothetical protein